MENLLHFSRFRDINHAQFFLCDTFQRSIIHYAAAFNDVEGIIFCLNRGEHRDLRDNYDRTPLHYAYRSRASTAVAFLIYIGADQTVEDVLGNRPEEIQYFTHDYCVCPPQCIACERAPRHCHVDVPLDLYSRLVRRGFDSLALHAHAPRHVLLVPTSPPPLVPSPPVITSVIGAGDNINRRDRPVATVRPTSAPPATPSAEGGVSGQQRPGPPRSWRLRGPLVPLRRPRTFAPILTRELSTSSTALAAESTPPSTS
ncbi:hypothetical protein R5R35_010334 [Gryllus longicercus]|uniref:Ankyrin repeat protein n=1 Tax=Gryllus longicercus TaxID=2509291 RepID=A0AAN9ZCI0_9ORTH